MEYTREQLLEAKRQIDSTPHKLRATIQTFEAKEDARRYKSQITLAKRRVEAFTIAKELIGRELDRLEPVSYLPAHVLTADFPPRLR